jgi:signal transduction histidine kinase
VSHTESSRAHQKRIAELEAALARERRVSRALREVGSALGTTLDLDDLLELILSTLTDLVEADRATLYLLDEATAELVSRVVVGQQVRSIRIKVGHGIAGYVAQSGKPVRLRDAYNDPRFEREWDALTGYRTASMLAAPLKNHLGRTIGVIQVLNKQSSDEFTEADEAMVTALCTQAAVAIDNSRLFLSLIQKNKQLVDTKEQLERRLRDIVLLFDLERATGRATSTESLAQAALGLTARACDARGAALLLVEDETGDLIQYVTDVGQPAELQRIGVKSGEGLLAAVMADGELTLVDNAADHPAFSARVEGQYSFPIQSVLVAPLEGEQGPLGAIALYSKPGDRRFDEDDGALLRLISANLTTAVRLFRASEARERSERLTTIGRLLSGVIHDFKTPMTVISGYVQLMQDADDREKRREYSEEILSQFDLLSSMQREVLEFARGERTIFLRRVYLKKFFADLRRTLQHEIERKPIELVMNIDTKVVARFDEARVARAIHNLARNAIEAMGERGGRLTIAGGRDGDDLVIGVSDTGHGIPPEIEGRLFQSFVTARKKGGTGLGLAIVKKIVDEHAGTIDVKSSSLGSNFELRLPLQPPDPKSDSRRPAVGRRNGGSGRPDPAERPRRPPGPPPSEDSPQKSS